MSQKITTDIKLSQQTRKKIKDIEDRVEQKYKAIDIKSCLITIDRFCDKKDSHEELSENVTIEDWLVEYKAFKEKQGSCLEKPSDNFFTNRDKIHEIKQQFGTATTLFFVDTQLVVNIEKFFSGLLLSYMTIFDKNSKRLEVDSTLVFTETEDQKTHQSFHRLRDKWYAHTEINSKKNSLVYQILNDKIKFHEDKFHVQDEYFANNYKKLYSCTTKLLKYIENDICKRISKLEKNLPEKDKTILKEYYKTKETENNHIK
ncbi:unnamed protein product [Commensalibacter communis]|uniref:hypothetical protein n=1 Tax=Commensalibacter communis TaxID=2972786 RepID=UPI0022FFB67F|nr:hypothetical protein [Commensalibacter communis]CAI3947732.1 unnamed protein product [Commensalibacter communis]